MTQTNNLVSVILPIYNPKPDQFIEAIDSVLSQDYPLIEVILVNDASTNNIEDTIKEYITKDPRIVYIKNKEWS
jgi:glycosyltransferase involved in cell wall biosynthesis